MSHLANDRKLIQATRFRKVVEAWLDTLPPGGWEGGSRELADELEDVNRRNRLYAIVPRTAGSILPDMEPILTARGFRISTHRTKSARTVRVERVQRKRTKKAAG